MSWLTRGALARPVSVAATYTLVVALALVALFRLPVALLPDLRLPVLVVWTAYPQVAPERVERGVTERIEEAVAGTRGLLHLSSRSQLGGSFVRLDFGWGTDLDLALLEVREQVDRAAGLLPEAAARPVVLRLDPGARPILLVALRARSGGAAETAPVDLAGLKELGREVLARRIEQLPGVSRVRVTGGFEDRVEIVTDVERLAPYGLQLEDLARAVERANVSLTGGLVRDGPYRLAAEVRGSMGSWQELRQLAVPRPSGGWVRLGEIATVREAVAERSGLVRLDGGETLLMMVERQPDANTVETAADVRTALSELSRQFPAVDLAVVVDESRFIRESIQSVIWAVLVGGALAILVLLLFIRRFRAVLAVAVAVPLSLALTLVLFEILDVSFNLISLSGLALGVGMLVDNAIVVVENVYRLRGEGLPLRQAAEQGTAEVAGAVTAGTLTTIAVFLPLSFASGLAGRLFRDQSIAVVCSLAASLLVALTAVPALAGRGRTGRSALGGRGLGMRLYERGITVALEHRWRVVVAAVVVLVLTVVIAVELPREVVPRSLTGRIEADLRLPPGTDLVALSEAAAAIEGEVGRWPEIMRVLADLGERDDSLLEADPRPPYAAALTLLVTPGMDEDRVVARLSRLPLPAGASLRVRDVRSQLEELLAPDEADLLIDLVTPRRGQVEAAAEPLRARLASDSALTNVRRLYAASLPAVRLHPDTAAMARLGMEARDLESGLRAITGGWEISALRTIDEELPIVAVLPAVDGLEHLLERRVTTPQGPVPLKNLVEAERVVLPEALLRTDQSPVVRLTADLAPGSDLTAALAVVRSALETLPADLRTRVLGSNEAFQAGLRSVGWSLLFSLLLVYLILAAQFENLIQPLLILVTVPLSVAGVALTLLLTGQTINLFSLTGCVVLVGIVVNDSIVKVDFINRRRREGTAVVEAIRRAGADRFRPIVMTSVTTMLGLAPLALGIGPGAELRAPLAITVIGGLAIGTLVSLLVVPVLYSLADRLLHGAAGGR